MEFLREKLSALVAELKADYNRPEGRWGMHGHAAVDDDYFLALEYTISKLDALLAEEAPILQKRPPNLHS